MERVSNRPTGSGSCNGKNAGAAIFTDQAWKGIAHSLNLSGRELQIVRGIFNDYTEFAIAADLDISPHTVHTHIERLHRKLGVANRVQLILRVCNEFLELTAAPQAGLSPICAKLAAGQCRIGTR